MKRYISVAVIAAFLWVAHLSGVWAILGGQPLWSLSATRIGLGAGITIIVLLWPNPNWRLIVFLMLLTAGAFQISSLGKVEFVGSYAENGFAGRVWYFGFIGFIALLFASLSSLVAKFIR